LRSAAASCFALASFDPSINIPSPFKIALLLLHDRTFYGQSVSLGCHKMTSLQCGYHEVPGGDGLMAVTDSGFALSFEPISNQNKIHLIS
jgi:hypothetical protein